MVVRMKPNKSQRSARQSGFAILRPQPSKDSEKRIPFGGTNFFPTSTPRALAAIHKCVGGRLPKRIAKRIGRAVMRAIAMGEKNIQAPTFFKVKLVLARVRVQVAAATEEEPAAHEWRTIPVCIHRGTHVNTRHNPNYIAPKKARQAAGEWKGGAR